jgi:hypothetical protein
MKNSVLFAGAFALLTGVCATTHAQDGYRITRIEYDQTTRQVSLEWTSQADATYSVEASVDLSAWKSITNGLPSVGAATIYRILQLPSDQRSFFRIHETVAPHSEEPIITIGHGTFIGADGGEITPTAEFIKETQEHYLRTLLPRVEDAQKTQSAIGDRVEDSILPMPCCWTGSWKGIPQITRAMSR